MYRYEKIPSPAVYSAQQSIFANTLNAQPYDTWSENLPGLPRGSRKKRDDLKNHIKTELKKYQGPFCAYCGIHFKTRGGESAIHRDHVLPKNTNKYRQYTFEPKNLVLACSRCNGLDFKKEKDYATNASNVYEHITFSIIHPLIDDPKTHIDDQSGPILKIINNSPKGIKTIEEFKLNEEAMICLRGAHLKFTGTPLSDADETLLQQITKNSYHW